MLGKLRGIFFQHWRILNTIGVVVGLSLPWQVAGSDVPPFAVWPIDIWEKIGDSFFSLARTENFDAQLIDYHIADAALLIGGFSLALYVAGNIGQIFLRNAAHHTRWAAFLPVTSSASMLLLLPDLIYPMMNSGLATGYYIILVMICGSIFLEGKVNMHLNTKYPYLTAWVGLIALNALVALGLSFIPFILLRLLAQIFIGFFIFKFVVERNILPYLATQNAKEADPLKEA